MGLRDSIRPALGIRPAPLLAALLGLTLLLVARPAPAPAGNAKTRDAIVRELGAIVKRIEGLERLRVDKKDPTKIKGQINLGAAKIESAKFDMLTLHLREETVYGIPFLNLFIRLENLDEALARAGDASRKKVDTKSEQKKRRAAVGPQLADALSEITATGPIQGTGLSGLFAGSSVAEAAKTDLNILQQDLESVIDGFAKGELDGRNLLKRLGKIKAAKHSMIGRHFVSEPVCGVSFDSVFRLLECIDERLGLAGRAAKRNNIKNAKRHLARAASCARALQANFLVPTQP